jgi:hypothetical protein
VPPPRLVGTPSPIFVPKADTDESPASGSRRSRCRGRRIWAGRCAPTASTAATPLARRSPAPGAEAERVAPGDPHPSLEERNADHRAYESAVTPAGEAAKGERFSLDEDVAAAIASAQAASVP